MNDLKVIGNNPNLELQTPIEIALQVDLDGNTTSKALYEFLELNPGNYSRWCKKNIENNPYAEESADYWAFFLQEERGGQASVNYKLKASFAKKLAMVSPSPRGEEARDYFVLVEENAKKLANQYQQPQNFKEANFMHPP